MKEMTDSPLYKMMHPKSVAFWGASKDPTTMGSFQLAQLLALGFESPVYPIHPNDKVVMGLRAYASIKDVPGPVDLAVFVSAHSNCPRYSGRMRPSRYQQNHYNKCGFWGDGVRREVYARSSG